MRLAIVLVLLSTAIPLPVRAFCGCMVSMEPIRSGHALINGASTVVLARNGDRTVLSMRNDYRGPPEDFALVVPIPSAVSEGDVRTLDASVFERLDRLTAPRLYDYYERDPCWNPNVGVPSTGHRDMGWWGGAFGGLGNFGRGRGGGGQEVEVESHFAVDEYDIVVLGASDSGALEAWLTTHGYHLPEGFAEAVRPYIEAGSRFFVARVIAERLELVDGRALLSPLRVSYRSEELSLPIRLGRLNSDGDQDVIVHIIAPRTRYEVASFPNATIPTHYRVDESVRGSFEDFYEALFAATLERNPGAVITEWAAGIGGVGTWDTALMPQDLSALAEPFLPPPERPILFRTRAFQVDRAHLIVRGAMSMEVTERVLRRHVPEMRFCYEVAEPEGGDVQLEFVISPSGTVQSATATGETYSLNSCLAQAARRWTFPSPDGGGVVSVVYALPSPWRGGALEAREPETPYWDSETQLVLTRLHFRYDDEVRDDLVFRPAEPITGGTYTWARGNEGPWMVRAAREHDLNLFEARYFIGHEYEGEVSCGDQGVRGVWEPGWTDGEEVIGPYTGMGEDDAPPPLDEIVLENIFREDVPELELTARQTMEAEEEEAPTRLVPVGGAQPEVDDGCGCRVGAQRGSAWRVGLLLGLLALLRRRR